MDISTNGLKILVVDDDAGFQALLRLILSSLGVPAMEQAGNEEEAIAHFASFAPHITLVNIQMPRMEGMEALKKIQQLDPEAFMIMMTSFQLPDNFNSDNEEESLNFLRKNIPIPAIRKEIKNYCDKFIARKK